MCVREPSRNVICCPPGMLAERWVRNRDGCKLTVPVGNVGAQQRLHALGHNAQLNLVISETTDMFNEQFQSQYYVHVVRFLCFISTL